jgi:hypothetical protein
MRKTKLFSLALLAAAWLAGGSAHAWDEPAQDADGVWQLGSVNDVEWFADYVEAGNTTAKAVLTADIDFTGQTHTPIGQNDSRKFNGVFDGKHHHIKNLHMTGTNTGFFGFVRGGTIIQNLIIDATCSFEATERCGSLIGFIQAKAGGAISINNVVNFGSVTSGSKVAGGILAAGHTNNDHPVVNMANCVNAGTITCPSIDGANPADKAAALIGWNKSASISTLKACYNIGECTPLDGVNNLFRGTNRSMPNCYDLVNTTAQGKTGTQGLKTDWVTEDPLHSGELCYVLNSGDMSTNGIPYKQDLSDPNSIPMPVADGPLVYEVADYYCDGTPKGTVAYSNTEGGSTQDDHSFSSTTGLCTRCSYPQEDWMSASDDGFYYLSNATEVEWFSHMVKDAGHGAMNVKLDADIDFGGVADAHMPIGTNAKKYFGHFDGQGHRIIGMVLSTASNLTDRGNDGQGFFGSVRGGGTDEVWNVTNNTPIIENLIIDASCSVTHDQYFVAGVVGRIQAVANNESYVTIRNCGNEANVTTTGRNAAGILGCVASTNVGLKLYNLWNKGNITGQDGESAAICAWTGQRNTNGEVDVEGCWNIGEVTGVDGNGYNMIRRNTNIVPRNIVDLCTTNAGNQGKVSVWNTANPISSGELCYLLNGDQSTIVYTQTLETDAMPVYGTTSAQVYQAGTINCIGAAVGTVNYNNESGETIQLGHQISDEMGMCSICYTQFQEPALVDGWYELKNAGNVEWFGDWIDAGNLTSNAKLMNDINFYSIENLHKPIGRSEQQKFNGTFDGQGFSIKNMIIEKPADSNVGFFGWLRGNNAPTTVKNLIIDESCSIHAYNRVGGVTGTYQNGGNTITIENVINEATVTAEHQDAGGIFGGHQAGNPTIIIKNVLNTGTITAKNEHPYAGALCCYLGVDAGTSLIENFVNLGTVVGHEGGNIGRHNISNVTNLIDLSATTDKTQGEVEGLTTNDIAGGKLAYLLNGKSCYDVNWTQTLGTDNHPIPFETQGVVNYISAAGYTTQYVHSTDVTIPADVEAYAGVINGSSLSLVAIEDAISKEDAVVLKGDEGYYSFVPTTGVSKAANNNLKGSDGNVDGGSNIYALSKKNDVVGFYPVASTVTIPAGKAYLDTTAGGVKGFTFVFDDATGLNNLDANVNLNEVIYNVAGQRLNKMQKGINIVNGKKVLF